MARRRAVHRRGRQIHARACQQPRLPRRHAAGPRARAGRRGGQPDRDHLADGEALRALSLRSWPGPSWSRSTSSRRRATRTPRRSTTLRSAPARSTGRERVPGDHITLLANPDYFGEGPYLERLIFKYIPDLTVLYTQFQTGHIDYTGIQGITADHYEEAKALADRKSSCRSRSPSVENIAINLGQPRVQGPRGARGALLRDDKQSDHRRDLLRPAEARPKSFLPRQSWAFNPDLPKHEVRSRRRPRRSWTRPAGSAAPAACARRTACGSNSPTRPPPATMLREQAQQLLQQNWQEIGAKMPINNLPPPSCGATTG